MNVSTLINKQLAQWPEVRMRYSDLVGIRTKTLLVNGIKVQVQYNPARERSILAKTDTVSVRNRPCFLCNANRPNEQIALPWKTCNILINPYPILPRHLTIAAKRHSPQAILGKIGSMLELAEMLDGFIVLYNGPQCGASSPDHFHFQAVESGHTPMEKIMDQWMKAPASLVLGKTAIREKMSFSGIHVLLSGYDPKELVNTFESTYRSMADGGAFTDEPKMNIICRYVGKLWMLQIIPRRKHRPDRFHAEDESQMLISPGAIDMAGVIVVPRESDFERVTSTDIEQIYKEIAIFEF